MGFKMKKWAAATLAAAVLAGLAAPALANQTDTSEATVEFSANDTDGVYPVYPEDPETDIPDTDEVYGPLAIVYATPLDFGAVNISAATIVQPLQYDLTAPYAPEKQPNIQTLDLRGAEDGWTVQARLSDFVLAGTEDTVLTGASITFAGANPNSVPTTVDPPEVVAGGATLSPGQNNQTTIFGAEGGKGTGHWVMRWYPENGGEDYVTLTIPAGVGRAGTYEATITWSIVNAET